MGIRGEKQASDLSTSLRIHSQKRPELSDIELIKTSPWDLDTLATILDQHNHDHVTVITPAKAILELKDIVNISLEHDAHVIIFSGDLSSASHIRTSDKVKKIEKGGHPTEILDAIADAFKTQADAEQA